MTIDAEVKSLKQVPMFKDIDPTRLKLLAFTSERVSYRAGQRLFVQGDVADAAFVLLEGKVDVVLSDGGNQVKVAELGQNAILGEMGILSGMPRSATVVASEPSSALRIDRRVFLELLSQFPQMSLAIMRELARRLERTNAQLVRANG
ncbi:MAG: Crp/Fnr family transcriptional regulator [Methylobacteriaceae bacterium]|nr:Crp/Fnr family transcriptional regulator [Methylobacteriaceae bacterium]